ncbi:MAG: type III-B CRISPR module RAMP protein Cmr4 [Acidobacteriota bacterium]|nr:type III-B CRISPR module RAMP protein Cmr4 [Acidobacteriota bacterium]
MSYLVFIHVLSPLHAGTGQGVGVIDLPIAREKATNLPYLPGSTLKGTLRDICEGKFGEDESRHIFGEGGESTAKSGVAVFSDAKLLCLPLRSLYGTFAWVTSPFILERFKRDLKNSAFTTDYKIPKPESDQKCFILPGSKLKRRDKVFLEDLDLEPVEQEDISELADFIAKRIFEEADWQRFFCERFCVVSDDVMGFLVETGTEVTARNRLDDETKTAVRGALWYEESLPSETILSGVVSVTGNGQGQVFEKVKQLVENPLWLGGHTTIGRGLCRVILSSGGEENDNT